ncbi:FAD dependent oxidoreductase [Dentipellis sp. KUC8613]|nr:FAD dependent oxidoreductase [Dentipellis sp. KUC8613]
MSQPEQQDKHVVVLGAGVVGLTTALKIQEEEGYTVTIVAETLPTDPKSIKYTSHWAGAHHVSMPSESDPRKADLEKETFKVMWDLSAPGSEAEGCFLRAPQTEYNIVEDKTPDYLTFMPDFKRLPSESFASVPGALSATTFTTVNINTPVYLPWLLSRFLARGGTIIRGSVQHVSQILEGGTRIFTPSRRASQQVDALVVCAGLGARTLGGVEDKDVHPVRGQTVILRAPWIRFGRSVVGESGSVTYIIPRRSGDVIVGGTRVANDWYPVPRPETAEDILRRGLAVCPELASPEVRAVRSPTVEDLQALIVEEGCGFRPARTGGIRLETELFDVPGSQGRKVPVIYNYGHGGYGFQASWGSANVALELLKQAVERK